MTNIGKLVTCVSKGCYHNALTRGRQYEVLAVHDERQMIKVRGDNNRSRWFSTGVFDLTGAPASVLVEWHFAEPVINPLAGWDETNNWVTIGLTMSDGQYRWCQAATPDYLKRMLDTKAKQAALPGAEPPAVWAANLIICHDLREETVAWTLREMDEQGELFASSQVCDEGVDDIEDTE